MKNGEINYIKNLGITGSIHAKQKPYSDSRCGFYLMDIGTIIQLLPFAPCKLLDMGCGTGWTSVMYAKCGHKVTGQDISPDMIDLANQNKKDNNLKNLEFIISDFEELNLNNEFDVIIYYDSLHHSVNEKMALSAAYRALKSNGILITLEPGVGHSKSELSIDAIQKYGVEEKDMPPFHIISLCKEIGFKKYKVYTRYSSLGIGILYNSAERIETNCISKFFRSLRKLLGDLKRSILNGNRIPDFLRTSNIVVAYKN